MFALAYASAFAITFAFLYVFGFAFAFNRFQLYMYFGFYLHLILYMYLRLTSNLQIALAIAFAFDFASRFAFPFVLSFVFVRAAAFSFATWSKAHMQCCFVFKINYDAIIIMLKQRMQMNLYHIKVSLLALNLFRLFPDHHHHIGIFVLPLTINARSNSILYDIGCRFSCIIKDKFESTLNFV